MVTALVLVAIRGRQAEPGLPELEPTGPPSGTPVSSPPPTEARKPTIEPAASLALSATATAISAPTEVLQPTPAPTNVPLPAVCLKPEFSGDVQDCGDIPHYSIEMTVDPEASRVSGSQEVRYTNLEDVALEEVYLRLLPNAPGYGGRMAVDGVARSGTIAPVEQGPDDSSLRVVMLPPLVVGQAITLSMEFEVDVPKTNQVGYGLFSNYRGIMALPTSFPLIPVYDEDGWQFEVAPAHGDDVYADVAAFDVRIAIPSAMSLVASGTCAGVGQNSETTTWLCEAAPVRVFVFIVSDVLQMANRVTQGVVVNSYSRDGLEAGRRLALGTAVRAIEAYSELFGAYPYTELDVVATPNLLGGMEYPGLVVVEEGLYTRLAGVEWLTAHEVAHQWWFSIVGNDPVDSPWLDEALTQYSTMLYYEHVYGAERGAAIVRSVFEDTHASLVRSGQDLPAGRPADAYTPGQYFQVVYDKGALYFHELRHEVGDARFFEVLRTYYDLYRYDIATPASFLAVVERVTGDPHLALYEEWIGPVEQPSGE